MSGNPFAGGSQSSGFFSGGSGGGGKCSSYPSTYLVSRISRELIARVDSETGTSGAPNGSQLLDTFMVSGVGLAGGPVDAVVKAEYLSPGGGQFASPVSFQF
ncbi:hypothetical protein HYFRA_00009592 [Hymenoscyphus fraxineus]|uniref:Uncharacterized protein n=1 Tax=Hymenoscyphus fraxineus TaxID=746836 RepID=A0A9N9KZL4_9HELO|nr:hypothetical protein HYFRA_00009592 [Hymenoscyphus fraxineus]